MLNKCSGGTRLSHVVDDVSRVPFIKLDNHLGNGGSFTLNGDKTVSCSVTLSIASGVVRAGIDKYNYYTIGAWYVGFMLEAAGDSSDSYLTVSPKPSRVVLNNADCTYSSKYNRWTSPSNWMSGTVTVYP